MLCLRNVVPAPFLGPRWAAAHTATLFSATLQPPAFHRELLGLPERTAWIDVDSPFERSQLDIHIARDISTRWQHREASVAPIVARIGAQHAERPGNYLAFFSSFDYLDRVAAAFEADKGHPIRFTVQSRLPDKTLLEKVGDRRYVVRQILIDDEGDNDWAIEGEIDLSARSTAADPLVTIVRIGA